MPLFTMPEGRIKFDRAAVLGMMDKKTAAVLSRFGAYVRQRAITSMLGHIVAKGFGVASSVSNRQGSAAEGQPPLPHSGDLVKRIEFAYDPKTRSVVIGPTPFGSGHALELEQGGQITAKVKDGRVTILHLKKHPYMQPAFDKELPGATAGYRG